MSLNVVGLVLSSSHSSSGGATDIKTFFMLSKRRSRPEGGHLCELREAMTGHYRHNEPRGPGSISFTPHFCSRVHISQRVSTVQHGQGPWMFSPLPNSS